MQPMFSLPSQDNVSRAFARCGLDKLKAEFRKIDSRKEMLSFAKQDR